MLERGCWLTLLHVMTATSQCLALVRHNRARCLVFR